MFAEAKWIGVPYSEIKKWNILQGDMNNRFAYFCLDMDLKRTGKLLLQITAAARYRLWINGRSVLSGPCKGDRYRQYYDQVDVSDYLTEGRNRFAVQVLCCDSYIVNNMMAQGEQPLLAYAGLPLGHRLAVEGMVQEDGGAILADVTTGHAPWKVYLDGAWKLEYQQPSMTWLGAVGERIPDNAVPFSWKKCAAEIPFVDAQILENVFVDYNNKGFGNIGALVIKEREIPLLYETPGEFLRELSCGEKTEVFEIKKNHCQTFIFDAGEIKTAFMKFHFRGGKNTKVVFTYSERFVNKEKEIRRDDYKNGVLEGMEDEIILDGSDFIYEPFWNRTFRFVKIELKTEEEQALFFWPEFTETGYPLEVKTKIDSSVSWVKNVWDMCVNTLKRCMNETYMDCPYYEQMQFPMDTRLQALYTYICSGDTRLAKKALKDFHYSMIPDGLIQGKYPCSHTQIISTFSLYYIFMLKEYYMQTKDMETLKRYRPDVDLILDYYDRKTENGLVQNLGYWEFVDWQDEWEGQNGAPQATAYGPSTIINLMYAYAMKQAAYINEATGRNGVAEEYRSRQDKICREIRRTCWSEKKGMFREGPEFEQYSVHAQAWAVLNDMVSKKDAGDIMERALNAPDTVKNSFSTSFEVFQALSIAGRYDLANAMFDLWRVLPEKGCTTCPEVPVNSRSECHAWSAQPIYEFVFHILGIHIEEAGWEKICIRPDFSVIENLIGQVATPMGMLKFAFEKSKKGEWIQLDIPLGMNAVLHFGTEENVLHAGKNIFEKHPML